MSEVNYGTRGATNTALGLSIGALGAELLGGTFGNILGGARGNNCASGENQYINRYEMNMQRELVNKDMEIAYLKGREASKNDDLESFKYYDGRFRKIEEQLCAQGITNAQVVANLSCMQQQIGTLMGLTKTIIPLGNVCPSPMPEFNSWTAPTATTATAG